MIRYGRDFWIRAAHPKPEHAAIDGMFEPPDDGQLYVPLSNFALKGVRDALKKNDKKNNTKQYHTIQTVSSRKQKCFHP
jgi:hypothetical protein